MRLHRFYVGGMNARLPAVNLGHDVKIDDNYLINQWLKVLRYRLGDELVLFDDETDKIYQIASIEYPHSVRLVLVSDRERRLPTKNIFLLWSLLKKDKNDWVLQKATELGVRNFVPLLADRSEKVGFNLDRANRIVIEAAEQCGRGDIPIIRESILLKTAINEYADKPMFICEQGDYGVDLRPLDTIALFVGPEGGWSDAEKQLFDDVKIGRINIASFTLRAETAAVIAVSKALEI